MRQPQGRKERERYEQLVGGFNDRQVLSVSQEKLIRLFWLYSDLIKADRWMPFTAVVRMFSIVLMGGLCARIVASILPYPLLSAIVFIGVAAGAVAASLDIFRHKRMIRQRVIDLRNLVGDPDCKPYLFMIKLSFDDFEYMVGFLSRMYAR